MSTIDAFASGVRAARAAKKAKRESRQGTVTGRFSFVRERIIPATGSIVGLGFLAAAAYAWAIPVGLAATGIAFLVLEWRVGE